jgi:hypothetical protein
MPEEIRGRLRATAGVVFPRLWGYRRNAENVLQESAGRYCFEPDFNKIIDCAGNGKIFFSFCGLWKGVFSKRVEKIPCREAA